MDITLQHIHKSYADHPVLHNLSLCIPQGSVWAIMAPSGAGKTTLLRLILGLELPDSGSITGVPARKSALFQEDRLCPDLSPIANIRMAVPSCSKASAAAMLAELGLADCMKKPAASLSGGMARRAALARALLCKGEVLVLDEPFTGLDEENRLLAAAAIRKHRNSRTLLLVTHRQEDLDLLDIGNCISL